MIPNIHFFNDFGCPNGKKKTKNNDQYISFFLKYVSEWNKLIRYKKAKYYSNIYIKYIHICMCGHL